MGDIGYIYGYGLVFVFCVGIVFGFMKGVNYGIIRLNIRHSVDIHVLCGVYGGIWIWKVD